MLSKPTYPRHPSGTFRRLRVLFPMQHPQQHNSPTVSTRIAVCSWSLRPASPADLIERIRRLGIQSVQLALSPVIDDPNRWGNAVDELRSAGLWVVSAMIAMAGEDYSTLESIARTGGVRPDHTWFRNREHAELAAKAAHRCGIDLVSFHAGFISEDRFSPERAKLLDRIGTIADIFGHYGIAVALETGQESAGTLLAALSELGRDNLGVNFDPANMILYGTGDPIAAVQSLAPAVRQVHIKDAVRSKVRGTWGKEVPVGSGEVDWPGFFKIALAIRPPVHFVIEREARMLHEADIALARDLITGFLQGKIGQTPYKAQT